MLLARPQGLNPRQAGPLHRQREPPASITTSTAVRLLHPLAPQPLKHATGTMQRRMMLSLMLRHGGISIRNSSLTAAKRLASSQQVKGCVVTRDHPPSQASLAPTLPLLAVHASIPTCVEINGSHKHRVHPRTIPTPAQLPNLHTLTWMECLLPIRVRTTRPETRVIQIAVPKMFRMRKATLASVLRTLPGAERRHTSRATS